MKKKILIEKCIKFKYYGDLYYHYEDLNGTFLRESNGFVSDSHNRFKKDDEIIETWYNLQIGEQRVPFFESLEEVNKFLETLK